MYYNYVLLCHEINPPRQKFYIGVTENLRERIRQHKSKSVQTTKSFDEVDLVYYEACLNKKDARRRELQLKTGFGRGYLNKRLENHMRDMRD